MIDDDKPPLSNNILLKILKEEADGAATYYTSELARSQADAMDRFYCRPYGDGSELPNRSQVVTADVRDTINWIMPALMRTFAPSDDLVTLDDDTKDDGDESLTIASQYLQHVFFKVCRGETALHDFIFDGLLQKVGILRTVWDHPRPSPPEVIEGLGQAQFLRYASNPDYQILEVAVDSGEATAEGGALTAEPIPDKDGADVESGEPRESEPMMAEAAPADLMTQGAALPNMAGMAIPGLMPNATFSIRVQKVPRTGKPMVECVPPERFRINPRARSIEDARYHAARFEVWLSDVITMYPDAAAELDPSGTYGKSATDIDVQTDARLQARFPDQPMQDIAHRSNEYREQVWLEVEYLRVDQDRDGIVELRRIVRVGDTILENEVAPESEFTAWSPLRISHRAIGQSLADTLMDIQKIRTVITRRAMDALNATLMPRTYVSDQIIRNDPTVLERMLDHDVGDVIPVPGKPGENILIQPAPDVSGVAFQAIEYWDRRSEEASGVNRHAMGIQPQAITDTARGIDQLQSAANARVEQIARHIGLALETAFEKLLRLVVRHQHSEQIFKVAGKRVRFDPMSVSDDLTVSVHVGMTGESREKKLAYLGVLAAKQEAIIKEAGLDNPLVGIREYRNTLARMAETMGEKNPAQFFKQIDPNWQPPQQNQPDPKVVEVQAKMQLAQAEAQAKAQLSQAELQAKTQLQAAQFQNDARMTEAKLAAEKERQAAELASKAQQAEADSRFQAQIAAQKAENERRIAEIKAASEMQLAQQRLVAEQEIARERLMAEMELARWKVAQEIKISRLKATANGPKMTGRVANDEEDSLGSVRFGGAVG